MQSKLQLLNQISDELNADLDLYKILQRVIDLTVDHFHASSGSIMLFDENNRVSEYILQQKNVSDARAHQIVGRVLTKGFAGWVLRHGRGDIIYDTETDNRWYTFPNQPYTVRSVITTPLTRRNRILGVLTVNHDTTPNFFAESDLTLVNAIAGQAAIAIENAQLLRQTDQERAKLSAIIHSTQDAIIVTAESDHKVLLLNPAAEKALQIELEEHLNKPLAELTYLAELVEFVETEDLTDTELKLEDGKTMLASTTEVPDVGQLTLMHDISALKALDKLKTEFITTFTHDLAAPLAAIKNHIELMQIDGPLTERQFEDLGTIRMSVDQMRILIEDLLELTRLESLKSLYICDVSLQVTLEKTYNTFERMAITKNIALSIETNPNEIITQGNPTLISRAVDNLVENAIKYTNPEGRVNLSLSADEHEAYIAIQDTGIGIAPKSVPQVFDKFFRAHATNDNEIPGSGLGLAIVKAIVERHGGRVWVESEVNQGSTFTIALPAQANGSANLG